MHSYMNYLSNSFHDLAILDCDRLRLTMTRLGITSMILAEEHVIIPLFIIEFITANFLN